MDCTTVLLFLLTLVRPNEKKIAFRVTVINALIYRAANLSHLSDPDKMVTGVMHLPIMIMALFTPGITIF